MPHHKHKSHKPHDKDVTKLAAELAIAAVGGRAFEWANADKVADFCVAVAKRVIDAPVDAIDDDADSD